MAGIYIHIPYCKQACYYCDFHFSTNTQTKSALLNAIKKEIVLRKDFFNQPIETLYFGGGTPSILSKIELLDLVKCLEASFDLSTLQEFTMETNPDDLTEEKLAELKEIGVDRLSIGIQSFNDKFLTYFNRAHDSKMAFDCIEKARNTGFENISIDLIFGIPNQSVEDLKEDLELAIKLGTEHISIYGLTIEKDTVFGRWYDKGKLEPLVEELAAEQLQTIMCELSAAGFVQYEISNFCKPGFESKHNSSYWQGDHYLGLGPAAHSYNGLTRQYNVSNNLKFIRSIDEGHLPLEIEHLSTEDKINEYILTRLRTVSGINLKEFEILFASEFVSAREKEISEFIQMNKIVQFDDRICLTDEGKLIADHITQQLMV